MIDLNRLNNKSLYTSSGGGCNGSGAMWQKIENQIYVSVIWLIDSD